MRLRLLSSMTFLPRIPSNQLLFLLQLRKSNQKEAAATKVFNRTKELILWAPTALSLRMHPFKFHLNDVPRGVRLSFAPKTSLFVLKL